MILVTREEKKIDQQIFELQQQITYLEKQRNQVKSKRTLLCGSCNKRSQISKWILIIPYFYNKSYSSYEDSTWDFQQEYHCVCPKCDTIGAVKKPYIRKETECQFSKDPIFLLYQLIDTHTGNFKERLAWYENSNSIKEKDTQKFLTILRIEAEKRKKC